MKKKSNRKFGTCLFFQNSSGFGQHQPHFRLGLSTKNIMGTNQIITSFVSAKFLMLYWHWIISPCSRQCTNKPDVYRKFCIETQFHKVLAWSDHSSDQCNIWNANEMDMTLLAVEEVHFYSRHKLVLLQLYINTRWSNRQKSLGYHALILNDIHEDCVSMNG